MHQPADSEAGTPPASRFRLKWSPADRELARAAEKRVFSHTGVDCKFCDTPVGAGAEDYMHSISAGEAGPHVVCMPGYSAASGFYYRNVPELSRSCRLHLVDWLGTGLSGRPRFRCRNRQETEDWFVEALDRWREANGIDKMVLVGHSLGGYLASCYAIKYPARVEHLVLVCPAGISEKPQDWTPPERFTKFWSIPGQWYRLAHVFWDLGFTPGMLMRTLGPLSRKFTTGYTQRRVPGSEQERGDFEPYLNQCLTAPGSGEFALRHLLRPIAWARAPMEFRLTDLQAPVTFIYGEQDWMDPSGAHRLCEGLRVKPDRSYGGNDCEIVTVADSGHFVFLEQHAAFNAVLLATIKPYVTGVPQPHHANMAKHPGPVLEETPGSTGAKVVAAMVDL